MQAIVDSSVLFSCVDPNDQNHGRCSELVAALFPSFVVPSTVIFETAFLVGSRLGAETESKFATVVADGQLQVENQVASDWLRIAEILEKYSDMNIGTVDASIVSVAERLGIDTLLTLDHRHFRTVKPKHTEFFNLLPE